MYKQFVVNLVCFNSSERDREVKGTQSKPNPSPNAFPKLCEWFSGRFLLKGRGTRTVSAFRGKSL